MPDPSDLLTGGITGGEELTGGLSEFSSGGLSAPVVRLHLELVETFTGQATRFRPDETVSLRWTYGAQGSVPAPDAGTLVTIYDAAGNVTASQVPDLDPNAGPGLQVLCADFAPGTLAAGLYTAVCRGQFGALVRDSPVVALVITD